jgi:hypothetical protein
MVGAILLVELALIFALSRRPGPAPVKVEDLPAGMNWLPPGSSGVVAQALFADAAVFGLPSREGFGASVWQPDLAVRNVSPEPVVENLAGPAQPPLRAMAPEPMAVASSPGGQVPLPPPRSFTATAARGTNSAASTVRIDAGLLGWQLKHVPALPVWIHNDVLAASHVEVLVDGDGAVVSASLVPVSSGLTTADRKALELAWKLRLQPPSLSAEGQPPAWGRLAFVWQTRPSEPASAAEAKVP